MVRGMLVVFVVLGIACVGCSRSGSSGAGGGTDLEATTAAVARVQTAARALATRDASVDYVAAQIEGVIKGRTSSQALIHYDGYRVTLTTPGDRVTRVQFDFVDARPTMAQLTEAFGTPEERQRGWLYHQVFRATGSSVQIIAEPAEPPATETSAVRRVLIQGATFR